ncbi:MAG: DUF2461 domain-containing protein [Ignavibacteria bacterium]
MLHKSTLDFLRHLKKYNNREWFKRNKSLYEDARKDFEFFAGELIQKISEFDESVSGLQPDDSIFRIYRDIRFSKDKSPYKINLACDISSGGKKHKNAGYYFHLQPGNNSFLAGGLYMPEPEKLMAVRKKILSSTPAFKGIINSRTFKKNFGKLWDGDKLKTAPKGFSKDHPDSDLLKYKSYIVSHELSDKQVLSSNAADYSARIFKSMISMNDFLKGC